MNDKIKVILALVSAVLLLILIFFKFNDLNNQKETDSYKFKVEYEELNNKKDEDGNKYQEVLIDKENPIKYSSYEKINKILSNETGVIYFGNSKSLWCRAMIATLIDAANSNGLDTIYYVNTYDSKEECEVKDDKIVKLKDGDKGYKDTLVMLNEYLYEYIIEKDGKEYDTNTKTIDDSLVVFVKDGKIVGTNLKTVDTHTDPLKEMSKEEKEELFKKYAELIHTVLDDTCDEAC